MPKTRKGFVLRIVLVTANLLVILTLLLLSGIMMYFSSSERGVIFGHTALLYTYFEDELPKHSLYIIKADDKDIHQYDEIMFTVVDDQWRDVPAVGKVENMGSGIVSFSDMELLLQLDSGQYIGKVISKQAWAGEAIYTLTSGGNILLSYVIFGGCFVLFSLVIVLVFAIKQRKEQRELEPVIADVVEPDEIVIENQHQRLSLFEDDTESEYAAYNEFITRELELARIKTQEIKIERDAEGNPIEPTPDPDAPPPTPPVPPQRTQSEIEIDLPDMRRSNSELESFLDSIIKGAVEDFERDHDKD